MSTEQSDPASASEPKDKDEKDDKGSPSRGKIQWALCIVAILALTIGLTTLLHSAWTADAISPDSYQVSALIATAVVLPVFLWLTRKKK